MSSWFGLLRTGNFASEAAGTPHWQDEAPRSRWSRPSRVGEPEISYPGPPTPWEIEG